MYQVVLDTNVLVVALRSRFGASHRLLELLGDSHWRPTLKVMMKSICSQAGLHRLYVEGPAMKNVQLPDDVYQRAAELAESDHVSVDRLVAALVNEGVGDWSRVQARAARGSVEKLKRVLSKVSDAPPEPTDQL
jgi:hypothetical protein